MDKKLTTSVGIALGATLIAGAGFGLYKFLRKKYGRPDSPIPTPGYAKPILFNTFLSNSLVKSTSLYGSNQLTREVQPTGFFAG